MVATKEIPEQVWADWDAGYQAAAADLDNRDEKVRPVGMIAVAAQGRRNMLFGVSRGD